jgi:diaminopimelate dehydrogenase
LQVIAEQSGRRRKCSVHARSCLAAARAGCESSTLYGEGVEPRSGGALTIRRHHEDVRALMEVAAPAGSTYTNFGPGMSMGHSVIARSVPGVEDAISITLPAGRGRHKRAVYVVPDGSRPFQDVAGDIASDPCFVDNETEVFPVTSVEPFADNGHAVRIEREGVIGAASGQVFEWHMKICNPAATAQIMLGALRAALRAEPGVYTLLELPIAHMLPGSIGENIRRLI